MQGLCCLDVQGAAAMDLLDIFMRQSREDLGTIVRAKTMLAQAYATRAEADRLLAGESQHWDVHRMALVDRNILRLALCELIEWPDVPVGVVMDEAIELGREFGDAETPHFINGVLDAIWKKHPACRVARGASDANDK